MRKRHILLIVTVILMFGWAIYSHEKKPAVLSDPVTVELSPETRYPELQYAITADFQRIFGTLNSRSITAATVHGYTLLTPAGNSDVIYDMATRGDEYSVPLAVVTVMARRQMGDTAGPLYTDGSANVFHVLDKAKMLHAVVIRKQGCVWVFDVFDKYWTTKSKVTEANLLWPPNVRFFTEG